MRVYCEDSKVKPLLSSFFITKEETRNYGRRKEGKFVQKIGLQLLEKITKKKLTNNEIDVLLHIARYQDNYGCVKGVYYKELCEELNISPQGFYDALKGLQDKEIISYKRGICDYDIVIIGNSVSYTNNFTMGYISLALSIFQDVKFHELKAGAKLLVMHLIRENNIGKVNTEYKERACSMQRLKDKFLNKFSTLFNVSKRTIKAYLESLKPFMAIHMEEDRKYYLTFYQSAISKSVEQASENDVLREQQVKYALRRNRIKNDTKAKALVRKLSVFTKDIQKRVNFDFGKVVEYALMETNKTIKSKYNWKCTINLEMIEVMLKREVSDQLPNYLWNL